MAKGDILIYSEDNKLATELISAASGLGVAGAIVAAALGEGAAFADELVKSGATKVVKAEGEKFAARDVGPYTDALAKIYAEVQPGIVLLGATPWGNELAGRLAARLRSGAVANASALELADGKLSVKRVLYGGSGIGTFQFADGAEIATVSAGSFKPKEMDEAAAGEITEFSGDAAAPLAKILNSVKKQLGGVSLKDAEVIVSCGRGIKSKEDLSLVQGLADALGGQVGCSRPISADMKWLPKEHWIGLSGIKVKPRIYIAAGISGQIQHLAGMRDADIIIAVNNDPEAPIFKVADYGIIGDLYKVLPAMAEAFKA